MADNTAAITAAVNSGNYAQAFSLANASGQMSLLTDPSQLYGIAPNAFKSQQNYTDFYNAFAPYLSTMSGTASNGQGRYNGDVTAWNGKADLASSAATNYADAQTAASRATATQGSLAKLPAGFGSALSLSGLLGSTGNLNVQQNLQSSLSSYQQQQVPDLSRYLSNDRTYEAEHSQDNSLAGSIALAALTAGAGVLGAPAAIGSTLAPAATAGTQAALGGAVVGGGLGAARAGITGGNPLTGALTGALGSGISSLASPYVAAATGLNPTAAGLLTNTGVGALRGALTGQGAAQGAGTGLISGLANTAAAQQASSNIFGSPTAGSALLGAATGAATSAVNGQNPIIGAGSSLINSGVNAASNSISNNSNTPQTGSANTMGETDDSNLDPIDTSWASNYYQNPSAGYNLTGLTDPLNGSSLTSGAVGSSGLLGGLGGALSSLLGGTNGGQLGSSTGLGNLGTILGALAGPALQYAGSSAQTAAARSAAGQFGAANQYQPYNILGPGGTASFNGTTGTGTLSDSNQQQYNGLLAQGTAGQQQAAQAGSDAGAGGYRGINQPTYDASTAATAAGSQLPQGNVNTDQYNGLLNQYGNQASQYATQASGLAPTGATYGDDYNSVFNNLQQSQQQGNNRFMSGNLDSQFANGVLSSTAGQYQTQAALDSLNKQTSANQLQAQNFALQNEAQQNQNFNSLNNASTQAASNYSTLGQNQYAQNANQNTLQYNRAADAFTRAMSMFTGGNTQANQNQQSGVQASQAATQGIQGYNQAYQGLLGLGGQLGGQAGQQNINANSPTLLANGISTNGNFLAGIGNFLGNSSNP